jgi:hypothetical protein
VSVLFDDEAESEPTEVHEPPIREYSKKSVEDGIWYFHAAYMNRGGWGSSTHFKMQVDSTPPEAFEVTTVEEI